MELYDVIDTIRFQTIIGSSLLILCTALFCFTAMGLLEYNTIVTYLGFIRVGYTLYGMSTMLSFVSLILIPWKEEIVEEDDTGNI